jgi:glycosyltransferase involved in cell wall biosynthesis
MPPTSPQKLPVTVLLAAKNEAVNLPKCLESLKRAKSIVVLDSQSTDGTVAISRRFGAKVVQFHYKGGYPKKRQWAMEKLKIGTPWILLIDADEEVPEELWKEIEEVTLKETPYSAFLIVKQVYFLGKKMTFGGFSFGAVLLVRKGKARFERIIEEPAGTMDMEVHERVIVEGKIGKLKTPLIHDDFKDLGAFIDRHNKYSTWEARVRTQFLETGRYGSDSIQPKFFGNTQERRRFLKKIIPGLPFEPLFWFVYRYIFRLAFLEGRRGWTLCLLKAQHVAQIRAKLFELELASKRKMEPPAKDPADKIPARKL